MPKFKNVSPLGDLDVPTLRRIVAAGEVIEVPADVAEGFAGQPDVWAPIKEGK